MALDPITAALNIGEALIDRLIPDKTAANQAKANLITMQVQGDLAQIMGQIEIDKTEASSVNWFVSGWRPAVGWVCVLGLMSQFLVRPFVIFACNYFHRTTDYPSLDMGTLMVLLTGMLGLGMARTVEKINDVAAK